MVALASKIEIPAALDGHRDDLIAAALIFDRDAIYYRRFTSRPCCWPVLTTYRPT